MLPNIQTVKKEEQHVSMNQKPYNYVKSCMKKYKYLDYLGYSMGEQLPGDLHADRGKNTATLVGT